MESRSQIEYMCKIIVKKEGGEAWPVSLRVVEDVTDFGLCHRRGIDSQTKCDFIMIRSWRESWNYQQLGSG